MKIPTDAPPDPDAAIRPRRHGAKTSRTPCRVGLQWATLTNRARMLQSFTITPVADNTGTFDELCCHICQPGLLGIKNIGCQTRSTWSKSHIGLILCTFDFLLTTNS